MTPVLSTGILFPWADLVTIGLILVVIFLQVKVK